MKPRIAVTMGDPAGIGPEICLDILADSDVLQSCTPLIFGDYRLLEECAKTTQRPLAAPKVTLENLTECQGAAVIDISSFLPEQIKPGHFDAITGKASYQYILHATEACMAGRVSAITTGPISKSALHAAGINYPGHTEILANLTGAETHCMSFFSDELICSLVTVHVGLHEVPTLISSERISEVARLTRDTVANFLGKEPSLAICGLNPHAGEGGLFGKGEEESVIQPAIKALQSEGLHITGPLSPDTAFTAAARHRYDAHICMYHDQALIPLKTLAFDRAVNVTLGLPIIRTSVDHGTAPAIAWQGQACPRSLKEAILLATRLSF